VETEKPDFWRDNENAAKTSQKISELKEEIESIEKIKKEIDDLAELNILGKDDEKMVESLEKKYQEIESKLAKEEIKIFLSGKYDRNNAIVEIFSGAGGTRFTRLGGDAVANVRKILRQKRF